MSKHDADCLRRRAKPGWKWLCTCGLTDEQVAKVITKCDSCDELPPALPFPNCKCFE